VHPNLFSGFSAPYDSLRSLFKRAPVAMAPRPTRRETMNKDTVDGNLKQVKGSVKEALGKVTGNTRLEVEGATEKVAGKAQEKLGDTQDAAKKAADKLRD
jgi:uncharacterized protein YjbJ (UPF0337 family)